MTQINLIVNSMPRDLTEFAFFLIVGFTAGSMGLIWNQILNKTQIEIIDFTGKSNFDLPPKSNNSITVNNPDTFFPLLRINLDTQFTVPPVASKSSTITKELNLFRASFCMDKESFPYSRL